MIKNNSWFENPAKYCILQSQSAELYSYIWLCKAPNFYFSDSQQNLHCAWCSKPTLFMTVYFPDLPVTNWLTATNFHQNEVAKNLKNFFRMLSNFASQRRQKT